MELARKFIESEVPDYTPNTFIGGIGATITTAQILATKLGISVNYIKNFALKGLDVEFYIGVNYKVSSVFNMQTQLTGITYYIDGENNFTSQEVSGTFHKANILRNLLLKGLTILKTKSLNIARSGTKDINWYLPNVVTMEKYGIRDDKRVRRCYLPKLNSIEYAADGSVFVEMTCKLYVKPSMVSNVELNKPYNTGLVIVGIDNFTPPNAITDLTITPTVNSATFNFTPPTGSTNAIDFYEVWIREVGKNNPVQKYLPNEFEITASGQTLTGLKVGVTYIAKLATIDVFYNGSGLSDTPSFSNEITFSTL